MDSAIKLSWNIYLGAKGGLFAFVDSIADTIGLAHPIRYNLTKSSALPNTNSDTFPGCVSSGVPDPHWNGVRIADAKPDANENPDPIAITIPNAIELTNTEPNPITNTDSVDVSKSQHDSNADNKCYAVSLSVSYHHPVTISRFNNFSESYTLANPYTYAILFGPPCF